MLKSILNKKGETYVEIMISVLILTTILIVILQILGNSKILGQASERRIEAVSLAKEGLEIFRYYREHNYVRYSDKKRICWNFVEDNGGNSEDIYPNTMSDGILNGDDDECEESIINTKEGSANFILQDNGMYLPLQNLSNPEYGRFYLTTFGTGLNLLWDKKNDGNLYQDLKLFQLCKTKNTGLIMSCESMGLTESNKEETLYFRTLKIEYINSLAELCSTDPDINGDGTSDCSLSNPKSLNQIKITSSVIWEVGSSVQSVDLTTVLTDYQGRKEKDS